MKWVLRTLIVVLLIAAVTVVALQPFLMIREDDPDAAEKANALYEISHMRY